MFSLSAPPPDLVTARFTDSLGRKRRSLGDTSFHLRRKSFLLEGRGVAGFRRKRRDTLFRELGGGVREKCLFLCAWYVK